jgi:serine protease Do
LPDQRQARADTEEHGINKSGTPRLGLTLAPASEVDGAGNRGVAVTAVDPNGPAAERGVQVGDVILDVAGKAVSKPADVRQELADLHKDGKHAVLMRMKSGDTTKFVAVPLGKAWRRWGRPPACVAFRWHTHPIRRAHPGTGRTPSPNRFRIAEERFGSK